MRAGAHVGQVNIDDGDDFGRHMNLAAREMNHATAGGVIVSSRIKQDITDRAEPWSNSLQWTELPNVTLKGFPQPETLWAVETAAKPSRG
jgi:class 3 adenylate cyclase